MTDYKKWENYQGNDRIITSEEKRQIVLAKERENKTEGLMTLFPTLDMKIQGYLPGDITVVSGITGEGKTAFLQSLTYNFHEQGISCLWFPFERGERHFIKRFGENIPYFTMPHSFKEAATHDTIMSWLENRVEESICKYNTKVVFIDHLHYLVTFKKLAGVNQSIYLGDIMRNLVMIADYHKLVLFLIAHLSKTNFEKPPTLHDIRDSSFVVQEPPYVIMITKKQKNGEDINEGCLSVEKNGLTGMCGKIPLEYVPNPNYIGGRYYEKGSREVNKDLPKNYYEVFGDK